MIPDKSEIKRKSKSWDESMDTYAKEMAMGFYRFTEWKPENAHWFNQEGEIIDIEDVWSQYLQTLKSKKINPEE